MLIIEIALGIVLGVIILANLDAVIALGAIAIVIAIAIGLLVLAIGFSSELIEILGFVLGVIGMLLGVGVMGIVAEKLFNLKRFASKAPLTPFPKSSHDTYLYFEYIAERIGLGGVHFTLLGIVFVILDANKFSAYKISAIIVPIYLTLIAYRLFKNRAKN